MDQTYTCQACGLTMIRPPSGPAGKLCPACMPAKNRSRALERLRKYDPEAAKKVEASIAAGQALVEGSQVGGDDDPPELKAAIKAAAPMLLALALSLAKTPDEAAELAGLKVLKEAEPDWFSGVIREAKRRHRPLAEARPEAIGGLIQAAIGRLALRAWTHADRIPPGQAAAAMRALAQVAELLQGGDARKVHTEINLTVPARVVLTPEQARELEAE